MVKDKGLVTGFNLSFTSTKVGYWCAYLSVGRQGMSSRELRSLIARKLGIDQEKTALRIERGLRKYLQKRGMQLDFFHGQLNAAIQQRYLKTDKIIATDTASLHQDISNLFDGCWQKLDTHVLRELPYHQSHAGAWDSFKTTLTKLTFLQVKIRELGPRALIEDLDYAFEPSISPDLSAENREALKRLQRALHLSVNTLVHDPSQLRIHLLGRLALSDGKCLVTLLENAQKEGHSTFLAPKTTSLIAPGGPLQCTIVFPEDPSGIFLLSNNRRALVRTQKKLFLIDVSRGEILHKFYGTEQGVMGYKVSEDQMYLAAVTADGILRKWEINTGQIVQASRVPIEKYCEKNSSQPADRYRQKPTEIRRIAFTANMKILTGSLSDKKPALLIWDIERGQEIYYLIGHSNAIGALNIAPDGKHAVSGDNSGLVIFWDLESGQKCQQVHTATESVSRVHLDSQKHVIIICCHRLR
jgi:hypothetical protein